MLCLVAESSALLLAKICAWGAQILIEDMEASRGGAEKTATQFGMSVYAPELHDGMLFSSTFPLRSAETHWLRFRRAGLSEVFIGIRRVRRVVARHSALFTTKEKRRPCEQDRRS